MQELVLAARPRRGGWETPRTRDMRGPGQCAGAAVAHVSPAVTSRVGLGAPELCGSALPPLQAGGRARRPEWGAEAAAWVRPARPAVLAGPPEPGRGTGLPAPNLAPHPAPRPHWLPEGPQTRALFPGVGGRVQPRSLPSVRVWSRGDTGGVAAPDATRGVRMVALALVHRVSSTRLRVTDGTAPRCLEARVGPMKENALVSPADNKVPSHDSKLLTDTSNLSKRVCPSPRETGDSASGCSCAQRLLPRCNAW